jgi:hypothetical protein
MRGDPIEIAATVAPMAAQSEAAHLNAPHLTERVHSLAEWICARRLQAPVLLFIEMHRPFRNVVHALTLVSEPSLRLFFTPSQIEAWKQILESPELLDALVERLSASELRQKSSPWGSQTEASSGS